MIVHKTKQGETFDILAKKYYGDEKLMHYILEANPEYRKMAVFDGRYEIIIPDLPQDANIQEVTAPWKR